MTDGFKEPLPLPGSDCCFFFFITYIPCVYKKLFYKLTVEMVSSLLLHQSLSHTDGFFLSFFFFGFGSFQRIQLLWFFTNIFPPSVPILTTILKWSFIFSYGDEKTDFCETYFSRITWLLNPDMSASLKFIFFLPYYLAREIVIYVNTLRVHDLHLFF